MDAGQVGSEIGFPFIVGCECSVSTVSSPVRLLVRDPLGRRIGFDPVAGAAVNEVGEGAYYSNGADGIEIVDITPAIAGIYQYSGAAIASGTYTISVLSFDEAANVLTGTTWSGTTQASDPISPRAVRVLPEDRRLTRRRDNPPAPVRTDAAPPANAPGQTSTPPGNSSPDGRGASARDPLSTTVLGLMIAGAAAMVASVLLYRRRRRQRHQSQS